MKFKLIVLLFLLGIAPLFSQSDSLAVYLNQAKQLELSGKRAEAKQKLTVLAQQHPSYLDFKLYKAQLTAFDGEYAQSLTELEALNNKNPHNYDILNIYVDVLRWNKDTQKSIAYCDTILKYYPNKEEILQKRKKAIEVNEALKVNAVASRFLEAKLLEKNQKRPEAKAIMNELVQQHPDNLEMGLLDAQLNAFDKEYITSLSKFEILIPKDSTNYDVLSSYIDVLRWSGDNTKSITFCEKQLANHPKDENTLLQKTKALENDQQIDEALAVVDELLKINPNNTEAQTIQRRLKEKNIKSHFGIFYMNSFFKEKLDPWHIGGVELLRKTKVFPLRFQLSTAMRFDEVSTQFEAEAYPRLNDKMSMHVGAGFSNNSILFPNWRSTLDIYRTLPNGFEASLGFRTLKLSNGNNMIYAVYLGKYYKKYWILYRGYYFTPPATTTGYLSHQFQVRRYYKNTDNYTDFSFYTGKFPFNAIGNQNLNVKTAGFKIEQQIKVNEYRLFKVAAMYENEEYAPARFRNRISIMGTIIKRF